MPGIVDAPPGSVEIMKLAADAFSREAALARCDLTDMRDTGRQSRIPQ
jgi:hypothetical protein